MTDPISLGSLALGFLNSLENTINKIKEPGLKKKERIALSKHAVKTTLLQFNLMWKTRRDIPIGLYKEMDLILSHYSDLLIEVISEVHGILPKKIIDELIDISADMKKTSKRVKSIGRELYQEYRDNIDSIVERNNKLIDEITEKSKKK